MVFEILRKFNNIALSSACLVACLIKNIEAITSKGIGAGGGTRTHTTFYGPRILSTVRLPFRHTGKFLLLALFMIFYRPQGSTRVLLGCEARQIHGW